MTPTPLPSAPTEGNPWLAARLLMSAVGLFWWPAPLWKGLLQWQLRLDFTTLLFLCPPLLAISALPTCVPLALAPAPYQKQSSALRKRVAISLRAGRWASYIALLWLLTSLPPFTPSVLTRPLALVGMAGAPILLLHSLRMLGRQLAPSRRPTLYEAVMTPDSASPIL